MSANIRAWSDNAMSTAISLRHDYLISSDPRVMQYKVEIVRRTLNKRVYLAWLDYNHIPSAQCNRCSIYQ